MMKPSNTEKVKSSLKKRQSFDIGSQNLNFRIVDHPALLLGLAIGLIHLPAYGITRTQEPAPYERGIEVEPIREEALSWYHPRHLDGHLEEELPSPLPLRLALKHFPRKNAQPVLLLHGLSQNDRGFDAKNRSESFARTLHAQGFDVWVGNLRNAGTEGFESETPPGPHHWTIEDYIIDDVPALVDHVADMTRQRPFLITHSLGAWMLDGWLAGLEFDKKGLVRANTIKAASRRNRIRGVVTIAGLYQLAWEHMWQDREANPILNETDYYQSNYELELLARIKPLEWIIPRLETLPLGWLNAVVNEPFQKFPWIGSRLDPYYAKISSNLIESPVFNLFYYAPNTSAERVKSHLMDGMESISPKLLEQMSINYHCGERLEYQPIRLGCDAPRFRYSEIRKNRALMQVPQLLLSGGRDRLASSHQVGRFGFEPARNTARAYDIEWRVMEGAGHLDILSGKNTAAEVYTPIIEWMQARY